MKERLRTIKKATVTVTFDLHEIGTFGAGSLFEQAKYSAAFRLAALLKIPVSPESVKIEAIESSGDGFSSKIEVAGR